ncbi:MAG: hypothetical protein HS108_14220 [Planctomycetes bacterium]|nr:hypothetical protein [Planctomycetota bacterium]
MNTAHRLFLLALLALAAAAPVTAQESRVPVTVLDTGKAEPGKEWTLKLRFAVPEGYHAYHKDNPGVSQPIKVEFKELSGLKEVKQIWPEPKKHKYDYGEEWELSGNVEIAWVFAVPATARGKLAIKGEYEVQFCDENGCNIGDGKFETSVEVAGTTEAPKGPTITATAAFEGEVKPGGKATVALTFEVSKGFSAYHKDSPGLSKPIAVKWTELNGLKLESETWPEPKKVKEEWADKEDWKLSGKFTVKYVFSVPADAKGEVKVAGSFEAQICDPDMCHDRDGKFAATATLGAAKDDKDGDALPDSSSPEAFSGESTPAPTTADNAASWPDKVLPPPTERITRGFQFSAAFSAEKLKPGAEVTLEFRFRMNKNDSGEYFHVYHPQTKALDVNIPLAIELVEPGGLKPVGEMVFPAPAKKKDDGFGEEWVMAHEFTVVQKFVVPQELKPGTYRVYGNVSGQYCDDAGCTDFNKADPKHPGRKFGWVAALTVADDGATTAVVQVDSGEGTTSATVTPEKDGLLWFLLVAFGAGMVTLLTPCVLPVLPLTVGFFVGQASKGKSPFFTAFIYCACILVSFTLFGLITSAVLGATGAQNLATNGYVNTFLALLFLTFALSFLGLFELRVPTFLTAWFSRKQMSAQQEGRGYAKAIFSGSAFSLITFSCTGPIAGVFLAQAATGAVWTPTLAMLAYASGMALPIFIMGLFPSALKRMPKSGGWMNAMKVVFGFIEIGLAIMYLSAAEQAFMSAKAAEIVNRYVVLAVWISVCVASALYLFSVFRMPHDHEKVEQIGVLRSLFAVAFLAFGLYLVPGLFGARLGATLEGILPPPPRESGIKLSLGGGGKSNDVEHLPWNKVLQDGLDIAAKVNKPVFIDFTGFN